MAEQTPINPGVGAYRIQTEFLFGVGVTMPLEEFVALVREHAKPYRNPLVELRVAYSKPALMILESPFTHAQTEEEE